MDRICKDCGGSGEITVESGNRSINPPYAPTMTKRYCDCEYGRALTGAYFGPHYPDAERSDRAIEAHDAKMVAGGYHRCGGDFWCNEWVAKEDRLCARCKDSFHE